MPPVVAPPITAPTPPPTVKPILSATKTGPTTRKVGEEADFVIEITNTGTVAANMLKIADNYDQALDPVAATDGHAFAGDDLVWIVDTLPPGKTIRFQVNCRCIAPAQKGCNRVTVTCQEGARTDAEACLEVQAVSAPLSMTVSDLRDPVAVGNDTTFEIRVANNNPGADRDVRLSVTVPAEMTPGAVGTSGPAAYNINGQTVQFGSLAQLRPGESLTYRVQARRGQAGRQSRSCGTGELEYAGPGHRR